MNSRSIYGFLLGSVLLALLMLLTVPFFAERIPAALSSHVKNQVRDAGHHWPYLSAEGRDLTVSGKAPTPMAHKEVVDIASNAPGIRSVTDKITPRIVSPYTLAMTWKDRQLSSSGFLPDEVSLSQTRQLLHRMFGENGQHDLRIGNGHPAEWRELVGTLIQIMPAFEYASADLLDQTLDLSGKIASTRQREQLLAVLEPYREQGYELNLHIVATDSGALQCQQRFNTLLKQSISFASGKNQIDPNSFALLKSLTETAMFCPDEMITIEGHTDSRGNAEKNLQLSQQRAKAVAVWLVKSGVAENRISVLGYGATQPIADNTTEAGRAKNRRIEFKVGEQ